MDTRHAAMIAAMLAEVGIEVTPDALEPDMLPAAVRSPSPPWSPPPSPFEDRPSQLPSFHHLTHLQPDRNRMPYKRSTHFATHLAQITGRVDTSMLPKGIVRRLRRSGVKPLEPLAYFRCRRLLKKWGYTSPEYRCIFAILKAVGGPVVRIPYAVEAAMRDDFSRLCSLFERRQPLGLQRKNFISYYLVVQLLLKKYRVASYYVLPSIKDKGKFDALVDAYCRLTQASLVGQQQHRRQEAEEHRTGEEEEVSEEEVSECPAQEATPSLAGDASLV